MRWFGRFLLWGALLAYPCYLLAGPYQRALIALVSLALGLGLRTGPAGSADLAAANMLGIYAAMCLASSHSTWARRGRTLLAGATILVALEWLVGLASVFAAMAHAPRGGSPAQRFAAELLANLRVVSVPLLWLLLLGRDELPGARGLQAKARRPRGEKR